ncbi:MAG TPA: glycosyltransferase family 1 protein [Candidatus Woesebacteria bacterium]|nr:glycosyltransferase family 1 protein [Candidatus Woesebacteria bacterium]
MKIGIDISMLVYQGSGVATYTYNLAKQLLLTNKSNTYYLFYSSFRRPAHFTYLEEFRKLGGIICDYPFPPRLLVYCWNQKHIIPVEWMTGKVDIFHSSDFLRPPLLKGTKGITTIHDLTWKIYPEYHTEDIVTAHERKLQKTIQYGDIILVDSKHTKKDLIKYYPQIEKTNSIHVLYLGIDEQYKIIKNTNYINTVLQRYTVPTEKKYILYVGAIEPRKNVDRCIDIFSQLIKQKNYDGYEFWIIGRAGWKNEQVFNKIKKLGLEKKIRFIGFVEDTDLPYFYNKAEILFYLSEYEGFGLPPLEAAYCGTPTLLYNHSSLQEIFKPAYPYTKKGEELKTVLHLLQEPIHLQKYIYSWNWPAYAKQFVSLL